jgi:hypothetical protein
MLNRGLIAAVAVVGVLILIAFVAFTVWYCCCRKRQKKVRAPVLDATRDMAGRELSTDPLAVPGMPVTLSKTGRLSGGEDDGLVGVNYIRAKYHDWDGFRRADSMSDRGVLWNNVTSWMCGSKLFSVRFTFLVSPALLLCQHGMFWIRYKAV